MQQRGLPSSLRGDRHITPARGQARAVSNIIAPTRPLGRQSSEWGSSWLAKISGNTLTVIAVAAHAAAESTTTALPACSCLQHVANVRPKVPRPGWMTNWRG
jgi:hypothetical protein